MPQLPRDHYVPQLLLRRFAAPERANPSVWIYDKQLDREFIDSIQDRGCERGFYDQGLDTCLKENESETAPIIEDVISRRSLKHLDGISQKRLTIFVGAIFWRTRKIRESLRKLIEKQKTQDPNSELVDMPGRTVTSLGAIYINSISQTWIARDTFPFGELLFSKTWLLVRAESDEFILGDHPLVIQYLRNTSDGNEILEEGTLFLPIAPTLALRFIDKKYLRFPADGVKWYGITKQIPGVSTTIDAEQVRRWNATTMQVAHRQVYASRPSILEMVGS